MSTELEEPGSFSLFCHVNMRQSPGFRKINPDLVSRSYPVNISPKHLFLIHVFPTYGRSIENRETIPNIG